MALHCRHNQDFSMWPWGIVCGQVKAVSRVVMNL
jgi:hypothetical protein